MKVSHLTSIAMQMMQIASAFKLPDKPPRIDNYQPGANLAFLPPHELAQTNAQTGSNTHAGIFSTATGTDADKGAGASHTIGRRDLGPMYQAQYDTLKLSTQDIVKEYFRMATNFAKNQDQVWDKDYDIFLKDVFSGRLMTRASKQEIDALRNVTHNSADLARNWKATRAALVVKYPALTPYIDQCILETRDLAAIPVSEGQSPNPYFVTPDGIARKAEALEQAADQARLEANLKSVYDENKADYILGGDMKRSANLAQLAKGTLVFKAPKGEGRENVDPLQLALELAPRAHLIEKYSGATSVSVTHFGPLDIRNDKYSPKEIRYEDKNFQHTLTSFDSDRFKPLLIVGNEFSTDNGNSWQRNPYPTSKEQEKAKYDSASSLIRKASDRMSGR